MFDPDLIQENIDEIDAAFHCVKLKGSEQDLLELLANFEKMTAHFTAVPYLNAIIKWYKNLFLQKAFLFQRAEQILDEALDVIEGQGEDLFLPWKVKIYLSLGYVHRGQWNYSDSAFYLTDSLRLAKSIPELNKFLGEIYIGLAQVSLLLSHHYQANKYADLGKKVCHGQYHGDPSDKNGGIIYAYALINHSRIRRLMGVVDQENVNNLRKAVEIASRFNNEKCRIISDLETAEFEFAINHVGRALEMALALESEMKKKGGMVKEKIQAALLAANAYKKIMDYELAEAKFNEIIEQSKSHYLRMEEGFANALYGLGETCYKIDQEQKAYDYFRDAARVGMVLGIKDIIIRSFEAARVIDKYKAKELLSSNLAYQNNSFVKNRMNLSFSPFKRGRMDIRLFATTLFVDIVDFSSLMKKSDETQTIQMVNELIDRMSMIIYQHNGYIDKFLGDGFMAIFEHGDTISSQKVMDAIRSSVDLYRALKHKNRKMSAVYGADKKLNIRIGISTGEIFAMILGNHMKSEFTYMGNSVNLASKLENHAINQSMLIDEETYKQAKGQILSEPVTITITGLGEISAHKVLRLVRMNEQSGRMDGSMYEKNT